MVYGLCNIKKIHGKGNHLILDGTTYDDTILKNKKFIKIFIVDLVKKVKMNAISKPLVIKYSSNSKNKNQDGITATIILAESNITIHTYPHYNFFSLDIFSCKEFNIENTMKYLIKELKIKKYKKKLIKRGLYNEKN